MKNYPISLIALSMLQFSHIGPTPTPTPTPAPIPGFNTINWFDVAIIAAILGGIFVIIAAIITAVSTPLFTQFVTSRAKLKKEVQGEQTRKAAETKAAQEAADARIAAQINHEQVLNQHIQRYRQILGQDPAVNSIKIPDMVKPIELTSIYVKLLLYQGQRATSPFDASLQKAESEHGPNILLQENMRKQSEEQVASKPIDPVDALRDPKNNRRIIILGDPGAGKTTLLKYLTIRTLAQATHRTTRPPHLYQTWRICCVGQC